MVALVVSEKFLMDTHVKLSTISKISKINQYELLLLENKFLDMIDFRLHIDINEYESYTEYLTNCTEASTGAESDSDPE